jgi:hypothetical protein
LKISKSNLEKLELLFKEQHYAVRYEKGNFNSGYCIVESKKIVVINRFYDIEGRINILLDILVTLSVDEQLFSEKSLLVYKQIEKEQEQHLSQLMSI